MGKLIESTLVSVDGVIEDPAKWAGDFVDEAFQAAAFERLRVSEAMLMGKGTYELLERDWAGQSGPFADRINSIRKYVVSSTLGTPAWNNSAIVQGDVVDEVRKLKDRAGTDVALYGHGLLAQTLLKNGLIDELRLSVFPVFAGGGKLFFREGEKATLRLLEATSLATGVTVMRYEPEPARPSTS
jgi:dihydrofolate reductase